MTIYMTSDLHVDHYINHRVSLENYINNVLKPADVLCVAGDTCDDPNLFVEFYKAVSPRYKKIFVVFGNHDSTTYFYFNGQKYLDQLKDKSIWLAGHTHTVRAKDLLQGDERIIQLKLNPVGYPDEDSGNAAAMDKFLVEK